MCSSVSVRQPITMDVFDDMNEFKGYDRPPVFDKVHNDNKIEGVVYQLGGFFDIFKEGETNLFKESSDSWFVYHAYLDLIWDEFESKYILVIQRLISRMLVMSAPMEVWYGPFAWIVTCSRSHRGKIGGQVPIYLLWVVGVVHR